MLFDATVDGRTVRVEVRGKAGRYTVLIDGTPMDVDCQTTSAGSVNLLIDGRSREAGLEKLADGYRVVTVDDALTVDLRGASA